MEIPLRLVGWSAVGVSGDVRVGFLGAVSRVPQQCLPQTEQRQEEGTERRVGPAWPLIRGPLRWTDRVGS